MVTRKGILSVECSDCKNVIGFLLQKEEQVKKEKIAESKKTTQASQRGRSGKSGQAKGMWYHKRAHGI